MPSRYTGVPTIGWASSLSNAEDLEANFGALQTWAGNLNSLLGTILNQLDAGQLILQAVRADIPTTLTTADEGALYYVTDFAHLVRWTGTIWESMSGGNRYIGFFTAAPGTGWALCNGAAVSPLVFGAATLDTTNITLPNLNGTATYLKSASSYSGSIVTGAGASGTGTSHTHTISGLTGTAEDQGATTDDIDTFGFAVAAGAAETVVTQGSIFSHAHTVGSLVNASESAHTHAIGTLDPTHLNMLPYFRL